MAKRQRRLCSLCYRHIAIDKWGILYRHNKKKLVECKGSKRHWGITKTLLNKELTRLKGDSI